MAQDVRGKPVLDTLLTCLAVLAFLAIVLEDAIHVDKAKSTLFLGTLSWILLFTLGHDHQTVSTAFSENILDIASLWLFLFAAMTFVAYLNQHGMVEALVYRLLPANMPQKALLPFVAVFAFVFSSFCDNITTTLVTVALIQSLRLPARNNIKLAVMAVFAINSGGAALITGDVTTLMIFTSGKVGIGDLFAIIGPGLIACLLLATLLMPGFEGQLKLERVVTRASPFDVCVAVIFITTILLTLLINLVVHVPPLLVFMFGLSLVFLLARFMSRKESELPILDYIRKIEFDTLLFFLGILLVVGMLKEIGTLNAITDLYDAFSPSVANFLIGCISAIIDNVPLTAAVLKSNLDMPLREWLGFTYSVGVGGSLLAIGSAAGVLMMSKIEGLGFISYLRFTPHLVVAYSVGYGLILLL
ncbi:MAG: sodium:proton antiporter NhaD [Halioglobus sp.]|nr:sodium:proton antiporter NhaD [Halioglobus sp.]